MFLLLFLHTYTWSNQQRSRAVDFKHNSQNIVDEIIYHHIKNFYLTYITYYYTIILKCEAIFSDVVVVMGYILMCMLYIGGVAGSKIYIYNIIFIQNQPLDFTKKNESLTIYYNNHFQQIFCKLFMLQFKVLQREGDEIQGY